MPTMANDKKKPSRTDPKPSKKYPSREKVKYVGIPDEMYALLEKFAKDHSDEDTKRSVSWAARVLLRRSLREDGYLPDSPGKPSTTD